MATFQPIDWAMVNRNSKSQADRYFQDLYYHDGSHNYPYCWGYTIFRTVYTEGSDEAFLKALERLEIYVKRFIDVNIIKKPSSDQEPRDWELWNRYYNEIIEDETLANSSVEEIGRRFDAWVAEHLTPNSERHDVPNSRFRFCIMLDQEGIDNLLAMPEDPHSNDPNRYKRWIKIVTNMESWQFEGRRVWIKAGIFDGVVPLWFGSNDPDSIFVYEMTWEQENNGMLDFRNL